MRRSYLALGLLFLVLYGAGAAETSLTIYHQDFAVVRDRVPFDLRAGLNEIRFTDFARQLEPASVVLRDPAEEHDFRVAEQSYRAEPVNQTTLLRQFEGQTIDFLVREPQRPDAIVPGKILRGGDERGSQAPPIIEVNGKLRFELPGTPLFPKLPDEVSLKPALDWKISSEKPAKFDAEISYLTGGLNWTADYNAIIPEKSDALEIIGWITITNQSGRRFENARTKLIAGDVNKLQPPAVLKRTMMVAQAMDAPAPVPQTAFGDYHLYTLPSPVTLRDGESKQIEFTRAAGVDSKQGYVFDATGYETPNVPPDGPILDQGWGVQGETKVGIIREFKNSEQNHLGIPLPQGRWRFYRRAGDQQLEFIGEHEQDRVAKDETLHIFTGTAFDLVAERKQIDFAVDRAKHTMDEAFTVTLRNHKVEPVEIRVVEHLHRWQSWEMVEHSTEFTKRDARTVEFVVRLKPEEEKSVSYRVRYTQLPAP